MIKKLLLVLAAFITGLTAYFTIVQDIPITVLTSNFTTFITSRLEPVTSYLANNKYTSLIGAGGITAIGILARQFQNMKAKATAAVQEATTWKNETFQMNTITDKLLQEKKDLEEQVKTLQDQVKTVPQQLSEKDKKIEELEKEVAAVKSELELSKLLKKVAPEQSTS